MMSELQNKILEILEDGKGRTTRVIADMIFKKEYLDTYHRRVVFDHLRRLEKKGRITSRLMNPVVIGTMFGRQYRHIGSTSREWKLKDD